MQFLFLTLSSSAYILHSIFDTSLVCLILFSNYFIFIGSLIFSYYPIECLSLLKYFQEILSLKFHASITFLFEIIQNSMFLSFSQKLYVTLSNFFRIDRNRFVTIHVFFPKLNIYWLFVSFIFIFLLRYCLSLISNHFLLYLVVLPNAI